MQGSRVRRGRRSWAAVVLTLSFLASLLQVGPARAEDPPAPVPGGKIVFDGVRGNDRDVVVADPDGTNEVVLTGAEPAGDVDPVFAPDATAIAFASCRQADAVEENLQCDLLPTVEPAVGDSNVFVMAPDGSGQTQLTSDAQNDGEPDLYGSRIVFSSHRDLNFEIYAMDTDGTGLTRLTDDGELLGVADRHPAWSPDGEWIAWARGGSIWAMRADGTDPTQLTTPLGVSDAHPAWSPDGNRIAFTRGGDIYLRRANGSVSAVVEGSSIDRAPTWSPDGEWLAFSSDRDGDFDIYRAKADGTGDVVRITENDVDDGSPDWVEHLSVTSDVSTTEASPASIPLRNVPIQPGAPASDPATAPIKLESLGISPIKLESLGISPIKLESLGISPIKLESLGISAPAVVEGLRHVLLSAVPLVPPLSWEAVLADCTSEPVHNLSLEDVLELGCDLSGIEWKDIDLTQPPFGSLDFVSILLGDQPIGTIHGQVDTDDDGEVDTAVAPADYWCPRLEAKGFSSCGDTAGGLDATTVDLQIAGVSFTASPLIPLLTFPLGNVDLSPNATSPLRSVRVAAFDMQTLIGALHVAELPSPGAVVDCGAVDCTDPGLRLVDAAASGAILPDARFEAMLGAGSPVNDLALGDIVYGLFTDFPIETIPFEQLGILGWGGDGSSAVRYTLRYSPVGVSSLDSGTVSLALPDTFFFDSATPAPDVVDGNVLSWNVTNVPAGGKETIEVLARPGVGLGPRTATGSASGDQIAVDGSGTVPLDESRDVTVEVTDTFEPNGDRGPTIAPDVLHVSFTPEGDGADTFLLPAPEPGSDVLISLSHQTVDRDLIVCAPPDAETVRPLRRPKSSAPPEPLLPDEGAGFDNASRSLGPDRAGDLPIPKDCHLDGVSQHREDSDEFVRTTASGTGAYRIIVAPYLGASSDEPYTLHVKVTPPPVLGSCQEEVPPASALHGTMPPALSPEARTLVLANENRMRRVYGDAGAGEIIAKLTALGADPDVGQGVSVLYVDGDPDVRAAYEALDGEPCSPELRNDVVRSINDAVDDLIEASPVEPEGIDSIAVIGDPRVIPQGLVADRTRWGNERSYAQTVAAAGGVVNDAGVSAAALGFLPTDNAYGDVDPTPVAGGWSYRSDWGVGRLTGSSSEVIVAALDRVIESDATIDPTTASTFATDFMEDTGDTVDEDVDAALGPQAEAIGDDWTLADLQAAATSEDPKDLLTILAHMDHRWALPPGSPSTLFDASHVSGGPISAGRTWVTMGCHSGYLTPDSPHWADAASGRGVDLYLAETGYGLGSRNGVALSERITVEFVRNLLAGEPAGLAASHARETILEEGPTLGVYEEKALEEATLYGWPGYRVPGAQADEPSPGSGTATDPDTGTPAADFAVAPDFDLQVTPEGTKFYTVDGRAHGPQHRPLLPVAPVDVRQEGLEARGWTIESLASVDELDFPSTPAQALLSGPGAVTPPHAPFGFVAAPSVPARIAPSQKLVYTPGLFQGDPQAGLHRLYTEASLRVFYGEPGEEGTRPLFREADIEVSGSEADGFTARVAARVTDGAGPEAIARVTAILHDESNAWQLVHLERDSADPEFWVLDGVPFDGPGVEGMFFAVNAEGFSAMTSSKALYFGGQLGTPAPAEPLCMTGPFPPDKSEIKAGSTNPVKFELREPPACEVLVDDLEAVREIRSYVVGVADSVRQEDLSALFAPTAEDSFFKFEWQTDKAWAGKDVILEIVTRDGIVHRVRYSMT